MPEGACHRGGMHRGRRPGGATAHLPHLKSIHHLWEAGWSTSSHVWPKVHCSLQLAYQRLSGGHEQEAYLTLADYGARCRDCREASKEQRDFTLGKGFVLVKRISRYSFPCACLRGLWGLCLHFPSVFVLVLCYLHLFCICFISIQYSYFVFVLFRYSYTVFVFVFIFCICIFCVLYLFFMFDCSLLL